MDCTKNYNQKQKASKEKSLPTHRIQCLGRSIHGDEASDTNDQRAHISDDHVQDFYEKLAYSRQSGLQ